MRNILFALFFLSSLTLIAQTKKVKVSLRNGVTIVGDLKELDALDHITLSVAGSETTIKMTEVAYIDIDIDNVESQQNNAPSHSANLENGKNVVKEKVEVVDKLANFKGFLLEKGNHVYVYGGRTNSEKAGADEIKRLLIKDGFWVVVDNMIDAHFTINYLLKFKGRDQAVLSLSSWRGGKECVVILDINTAFRLEYDDVSREEARDMYYDTILSFQKKIENNTLSKTIKKKFSIE